MRITPLFAVLGLTLGLAACSGSQTSITRENRNPLTASRYGDELADTMANLVIANDPILKDAAIKATVEEQITLGKQIGAEARAKQAEGMQGTLIPVTAEALGYVLYVDDTLYLSSDFQAKPGAALHAYMTVVVDPRDGTFPDATAIDLGSLQSVYGAQQYDVPHQENPMLYRTFVLYDAKLKRIEAFAQLSK